MLKDSVVVKQPATKLQAFTATSLQDKCVAAASEDFFISSILADSDLSDKRLLLGPECTSLYSGSRNSASSASGLLCSAPDLWTAFACAVQSFQRAVHRGVAFLFLVAAQKYLRSSGA